MHIHIVRGLSVLAVCLALCAHADDINVAVAANFLGTLEKMAPTFEQASGHKLILSAGSSGQFYTQIKQGAPFDVFLSADSERPKRLEAEGLGAAGSRFTYATGTLVLWSPKLDIVDAEGKVLQAGRYRFLAIADPRTAPYGAAAQQVLKSLGLWEELNQEERIVIGQNVNQAWQFAASGSADMAFVALAQIGRVEQLSGSYWIPSDSLYRRLDQDAVLLTRTTKHKASEAFLTWLRTDRHAIAAIKAAGYRVQE